jgi:protein gp37
VSQLTLSGNVQILAPMTKDEAQQCLGAIKNHISEARELVYDLYIREGWKALGYSSWATCVESEFQESRTRLYQLLDAARTERNLLDTSSKSTIVDSDDSRHTIPESHLRPIASLHPDEQREVWTIARDTAPVGDDGQPRLTGAHVQQVVKQWTEQREQPRQPISQFNRTNENIEWAAWSWNPVTGCKHGCPYCYARDIANRFYPQGFAPTFHPDRLVAPQNTPRIHPRWEGDIGYRGVFVCSMADLFGEWVPQEWIDAVLASVQAAPQWTFIFLTKNARRLADIEWPDNAWVGTTVDRQSRVEPAQAAFANVRAQQKFVSCEPMLERLTFTDLAVFDWVIIGGQSRSSGAPEFQPEWPWVESLLQQARSAGAAVYWKDNLKVRPREYPTS